MLSLFLLHEEVLNYRLETIKVEKEPFNCIQNDLVHNLVFYWQPPLYVFLEGNNSLLNGFYPLFAAP